MEFHFFWSGPFSQWAIRPTTIDGVKFNCCEQYMMAEKARLFSDSYVLSEVMRASDPAVQKVWGRRVQNFDKAQWDKVARHVVFKANYAKFTQHPDLLKKLAETGEKVIVEASPEDTIWGIGLSAKDPRAQDPAQWRGTNWLGEAIMQVRTKLREEGKL